MRSAVAFLVLVPGVAAAQQVSVRSLLPQMWDLRHLTRPPKPSYTEAQASSYDRASDPGPKQDWFANGDAGQFLRTENTDGRTEQVMADLKGPGTVVRIWSANPQGTIRFYFDGETTPRLVANMSNLLTGKVAPFRDPFAYNAANGCNLYFPLPYAKSLKVTAEGSNGLYYHVNYRTYAPRTRVATFDQASLDAAKGEIKNASDHLAKNDPAMPRGLATMGHEARLKPGQREPYLTIGSGGTISELTAKIPFPLVQSLRELDWTDPHQPHNVLRSLVLEAEFDGERTIVAPLGDFFNTSPGINPLRSLPFEVREDGTLICRLPMPFQRSAKVWITNGGSVEVPVKLEAKLDPRVPASDAYHLHAGWGYDTGLTRPMKDMEFLNATGQGYWIGSNLEVTNPVPDWWGEGDEKVYVDGESFPSTFGTGSEDYYGYAWSSPLLFQRPYHAQTRCEGPGTMGHPNVHRWHLFDPIPFTTSLRFDLEKWHWATVDATWAWTAFWYAKPGGSLSADVPNPPFLPRYIEKPSPVKGALEGESLTIAEQHGGKTQQQDGFWQLSSGKQLWWTGVSVGDRLTLQVPIAEDGTYEVVGNFCFAHDYGVHKMRLNGQEIAPIDFYGEGVDWKKVSLGNFTLSKGTATLEIECVGQNPKAVPERMFGLDYLLLNKK